MQANVQGWHTEKWGTWGWIETVLKLAGVGVGLVALVRAFPLTSLSVTGHPHLAAVIVLAVLTLVTLVTLGIRFTQRETISMIFALLNLVGHVALLIALLQLTAYYRPPILFGVFYVLGQLAKIQFLRVSGYTEGGTSHANMLRVTVVITVIYAVFVVLMLV